MIGQSVINIESGGRTRLSALAAGVFLLINEPSATIVDKFSVHDKSDAVEKPINH